MKIKLVLEIQETKNTTRITNDAIAANTIHDNQLRLILKIPDIDI